MLNRPQHHVRLIEPFETVSLLMADAYVWNMNLIDSEMFGSFLDTLSDEDATWVEEAIDDARLEVMDSIRPDHKPLIQTSINVQFKNGVEQKVFVLLFIDPLPNMLFFNTISFTLMPDELDTFIVERFGKQETENNL